MAVAEGKRERAVRIDDGEGQQRAATIGHDEKANSVSLESTTAKGKREPL